MDKQAKPQQQRQQPRPQRQAEPEAVVEKPAIEETAEPAVKPASVDVSLYNSDEGSIGVSYEENGANVRITLGPRGRAIVRADSLDSVRGGPRLVKQTVS